MRCVPLLTIVPALLAGCAHANSNDDVIVPVIEGDWWRVASNPDLGEYTSEEQEPVDFGLWQAADGTWQLWSCIRETKYPGHTRLFHGWEGANITDKDWKPLGITMTSKPELGEPEGGLQAPHVVRHDGKFVMAYGDWTNICFATSTDGKSFERIIQPDGKTGLFSEGAFANSRDPMMVKINGRWHLYYTAITGGKGYGYCRLSDDLKTWSPSIVVSYGGAIGDNPWWNECPQVVEVLPGEFVYFRNQFYGGGNKNWVYYSKNPFNFGIDNDEGLVTDLNIAAPEVVEVDGKYYIAALTPELDGIRIARLRWARRPAIGVPVYGFDDPEGRAKWTMTEGDFDAVFFTETHAAFGAVTENVIGTCEQLKGEYDDERTGVIESEPFVLDEPSYTLLVGGGSDEQTVYVAIVEEGTGEELARYSGKNQNTLQKVQFNAAVHGGKTVRVRVVDKSKGPWGHINFGGIYRPGKPEVIK
ncbi:MAG: hypothetical protein PWP23_381 [Candidatus Sumerlaeota bacterium]|nr:hypothetical protein [Candidatus Sumerlaeota bacterium]